MFDEERLCQEEERGRWRACCVLVGTVLKSLNHFLYQYIILKSNYLINDGSLYLVICMSCLLWNSTRSSRQDARGRTGDGGRGVSFETISPSIRSGPRFPHYMCQWARRLSRVKLAVILCRSMCGYISGTRYLKWLHTKYQVSKMNIWYRMVYTFILGGVGLVGLVWETKHYTPWIIL